MTANTKRPLTEGQLWVLMWLAMMPLLSVDLLERLGTYKKSFLYHQLRKLEKAGLVLQVRMGMTSSVQSRWFLTSVGIKELLSRGIFVSWAAGEAGIKWLCSRFPAVEQIYPAAIGLWTAEYVNGPGALYLDRDPDADPLVVPEGCPLREFRWMGGGCVLAMGIYGDERIWVPFQWVGIWNTFRNLVRRWKKPFSRVGTPANGVACNPLIWVVCALDLWAGYLGKLTAPLGVRETITIITPDGAIPPIRTGALGGVFTS